MKKNYIKIIIVAILFSTVNSNLNAQNIEKLDGDVWEGCIIKSKPFSGYAFVPRPNTVAYNMDNRVMPCSSFIVTYNGFTPEAQAAFQYAIDIWSNLLDSPVPIRVDATFAPAAASNLGSAGPAGFLINDPAFMTDTAYAIAMGESIIGEDSDGPAGTSNDISCNFNSNRTDWYFGTDGNPGPDEIDFVSVVLHELGHGLGLLGFGRVDDNDNPTEGRLRGAFSDPSLFEYIHVWDRFIDGTDIFLNPTPITGFPDPSGQLLNQYTNNEMTCNSPLANAQNSGVAPEMYSPSSWGGGSSYSHLDEATYPNANENALMTPFLSDGVAIHNPGPIILGFMQDMGWNLCPGALSQNEFAIGDFTVSPNPFADKVSINISNISLRNDTFNLELIDINGRAVISTQADGSNGVIEFNKLESLSPAIYFIKITSQASGSSITKKVIKN
ncbi:T9SS type A sorting domain-containing protein [Winogradskyella sp. A3E31]|uniref:T9SS type A sorting domain-containing protein n=1 Tax=Winogradskyella sp. A3E31 TaxID=3349637 RepID=UPI00398B4CD5